MVNKLQGNQDSHEDSKPAPTFQRIGQSFSEDGQQAEIATIPSFTLDSGSGLNDVPVAYKTWRGLYGTASP